MREQLRTLVFDMDGTLLDTHHNIQPKTKEAILKLQDEGVKIILASGRPYRSMINYARELELDKHDGVIVCNNGALAYKVVTGEKLLDNYLRPELINEIIDNARKFNTPALIQNGEYMLVEDIEGGLIDTGSVGKGVTNVIYWESEIGGFKLKEVEDLKKSIDFRVNKILTVVDANQMKEKFDEIAMPLKDKAQVVQTAPFYIEYMNLGINKVHALKELGIDHKGMMSFGDSMNDKEMVEYAEIGVCMARGADSVRDVATYVTGDRDDEGIYKALVHFGIVK